MNARENLNRMEIECLNEVRKIERCMKDIIDLVDTWRNLSAQLETTRKATFNEIRAFNIVMAIKYI